jgi:uncharacterized phage infection (PIP) family protein YhgE
VRNLAQRSATAAKETSGLIENASGKISEIDTLQKQISEAMSRNMELGQNVSQIVNEVSVAVDDQASGVGQMNTGIGQINQAIQDNAASAEENDAASMEIHNQVRNLAREIGEMNKLLAGNTTQAPRPERGTSPSGSGTAQKSAAVSAPVRKKPETVKKAEPKPVRSEMKPEQIIPLDDDDMEDF